jgi:hypothetical protein
MVLTPLKNSHPHEKEAHWGGGRRRRTRGRQGPHFDFFAREEELSYLEPLGTHGWGGICGGPYVSVSFCPWTNCGC